MTIDSSIPFRAFATVPLMSVQDHQQNALARQMQQLQMQGAQGDMQDRQTVRTQQNALARAMSGARNVDGSVNYNALSSADGIDPAKALEFSDMASKQAAKQKTAAAEAEKAKLQKARDHLEIVGQVMGGANDQQTYTQSLAQLQSAGIDISQMPAQFDPAYVRSNLTKAMDAKAQLEQHWKEKGYVLDVRKQTETERNNGVQNRVSMGNLGVAQANLGLSRQRLSMEQQQPKGQYDSSRGIIVDQRTGQAMPVTMQDGAPLPAAKKTGLKMIPATVNRGIVENVQSLDKVEKALKLADGNTVGGMKGDKNATGWKGLVPDAILNRTDPKGTATRALIADIGSLKIHDRSGAAVTAAETPRLKPFIPSVTDDAPTVKKKLELFKAEYQQMIDDMAEIYSEDQGYVPNPALERRKTRQTAPAGSGAPSVDDLLKKYGN